MIAIVGEFDALPGLSQDAVPARKMLVDGGPGHGCGHHLFGTAAAAAAIAVKDWLAAERAAGTVRFYGTPAEEGGGGQDLHDPGRALQGRGRGRLLASGRPQPGHPRHVPRQHQRQVPIPWRQRACRRRTGAGPLRAGRRGGHERDGEPDAGARALRTPASTTSSPMAARPPTWFPILPRCTTTPGTATCGSSTGSGSGS